MPDISLPPAAASNWLFVALSDERWFGGASPSWLSLPNTAEARTERLKRVRLLKKHGVAPLAIALSRCASRARCLSGACPECGRALQRLIAKEARGLLVPHTRYDAVSLIGFTHRQRGKLHSLDIQTFRRMAINRLNRAKVRLALGGIDFSFNEFPGTRRYSRWVPQLWLLVNNANRARWERVIRSQFARTPTVHRPVKIQSWDGSLNAIGYALKTDFVRRKSYQSQRFARGEYRPCRNTRADRLRAAERVELYQYLHRIGLEARLVLAGFERVDGGLDVAL